ncbi:MAG: hypothetical protein ACE37F_22290 [Nannocystaceae bacterium]|nr:hypothetical protein [bacterium]
MFRSPTFILSALFGGICLSWPTSAEAAAGAEAPGVIKSFKCDETTISEAIDLGGGDWNYRYAAKCFVTYVAKVSKPRDMGWGLAGPEPAPEPESAGGVVITGVGTYRAKTNEVVDSARIEGNVVHRVTDVVYALDLGVQSKYRCTRDPFVYQSGAVCIQKAMTIKGEGWSQFKVLTHRRRVPFGTWGITLAARNEIAKKGKPLPPPPPPKKKEEEKNPPAALDRNHQGPTHKAPSNREKPRKKGKRRLKRKLDGRKVKKTKTRGG